MIKVVQATYRPSIGNGDCLTIDLVTSERNIFYYIDGECTSRKSCNVDISTAVDSDPSTALKSYLKVNYYCEGNNIGLPYRTKNIYVSLRHNTLGQT